MSHPFDDLAISLAGENSRRGFLKQLSTGLGALGLALLGLKPASAGGGNAGCAAFCNALYPPGPARARCHADAAKGMGICYECGPASKTGAAVCGSVGAPYCAELDSDPLNCGECGNVCASDSTCTDGECVPNTPGLQPCGDGEEPCPDGFACINWWSDGYVCYPIGTGCIPDCGPGEVCIEDSCYATDTLFGRIG
jgi:hypothetical protein